MQIDSIGTEQRRMRQLTDLKAEQVDDNMSGFKDSVDHEARPIGQLTGAKVEQVDDYTSELQAAVNHEAPGQIGEFHLTNTYIIIFVLSSVLA